MTQAQVADGAPCWADVMVHDVDAAIDFYGGLFGWTVERSGPEFGGYAMASRDGVPAAGIGPITGDYPPSWTIYLSTSDLAATLDTVTRHGGQVLAPPMAIGPLGQMAVIADPAMAVCGLWQAGDFTGFGRVQQPGFIDWCDVQSTDISATRTFLRSLFGYTESRPDPAPPMDDFRQLDLDGVPMLGSMGAFAAPVSFWMAYLTVVDVGSAAAYAESRGGRVLYGPEVSPFGPLATLADPEGAVFSVIGAQS